jgi:hypothetical protein
LGCSSVLVLLPVTYAIVGLVAPADPKDGQGLREFFETIGVPWLGFLADTTGAHIISLIIVGALVSVAAFALASIHGHRVLKRLPCPRCGATPLDSPSPQVLICARCQVAWELELMRSTSTGESHDPYVHHHPH